MKDASFRAEPAGSTPVVGHKEAAMPGPDILFVHLPFQEFAVVQDHLATSKPYGPQLVMPLGLLYLSSYLKAASSPGRVGLLDYEHLLRHSQRHADILSFLRREAQANVDFTPDLIAISLNFSLSWPYFERVVPVLKALWPKATILAGGTHATNTTKFILDTTAVDYVLRGEGEMALARIVQQWGQGKALRAPGLYSRADAAFNPDLGLGEMVEDLDSLPFPDWSLLDMEAYLTTSSGWQCWILPPSKKRVAPILTSRGCPHQCTYCSGRTVHGRRVRFRSIENVIAEVRHLHEKYGVTLFIPFDDMVTAKRNRLFRLLDAFEALKIPDVEMQFPNALNVNTTDEATIDRLMACGTKIFNFAVESGSPYVQKHIIKKNCDLVWARELIRMCREKGALTICYFIYGFPHETREMMEETSRYIRELETDWANPQIAVPLVGTGIYKEFVDMGAIPENAPALWSNAFFWERPFDTPDMGAAELKAIMTRAHFESNFVFNPNLKYRNYERALLIFQTVADTFPTHVFARYGLYLTHTALGNADKAEQALRDIRRIVALDAGAARDFEDHRDLFAPEISGTRRFVEEPFGHVFTLRDQGRFAEALELLRLVEAETPGNMEIPRTRGGILSAAKDYEASVAAFREVLAREPFRMDVLLNVSDVLRYAGRFEESLEALAGIEARRPLFRELAAKRGQVCEAMGRPKSAVRWFLREFQRYGDPFMLERAEGLLASMGRTTLAGVVRARRELNAAAPRTRRLTARTGPKKDPTRPNVLLVHLPLYDYGSIRDILLSEKQLFPQLVLPLGLLYLSSTIKAQNRLGRVELIDYALKLKDSVVYDQERDFIREETVRQVGFAPDVIALSFNFSVSYTLFNPILEVLKELWPGATTIVGGVHASNTTPILLRNHLVDFVLRGEGEIAFSQFLDQMSRGKTPGAIKGLYARKDLARLGPLDMAEPVPDLDALPLPDWDILQIDGYLDSRTGWRNWLMPPGDKRSAGFQATRGCPNKCTYCSAHTVHGRNVRFRSVDKVLEEIRILHEKYGVNLFVPWDDLMTANKKRLLSILSGMRAMNIPDLEIQFPNGLHVGTMDEEIIDAMVDTGCSAFTFAIESGSEFTQKHIINKRCNLDKARRLIEYVRGKGVMSICYWIVGLPGETKELMAESYAYAKTLSTDWIVFSKAIPLVGTEIFNQYVEKGYFQADDVNQWTGNSFYLRSFDTEEISAYDLSDLVCRMSYEYNFVNNVSLKDGTFQRAVDIYSTFLGKDPNNVFALYCTAKAKAGLGQKAEAQALLARARELVQTTDQGRFDFAVYGDLLPDLGLEWTPPVHPIPNALFRNPPY
jgi:radical SAM superfamily enzyme YgiQ (UPF0313 family)